ncbi:MAG: hypothetical protein J6V53_06085 [Alphaproteobacteria bacterium]|nr:hypothetical protein [Alphaproteobacteria bacterium]
MEEIKKAINGLEQALVSLETALLQTKKDKEQSIAKVDELKKVIHTTYSRLDSALLAYHQDQGSE